jgi:hypothetical protein
VYNIAPFLQGAPVPPLLDPHEYTRIHKRSPKMTRSKRDRFDAAPAGSRRTAALRRKIRRLNAVRATEAARRRGQGKDAKRHSPGPKP